MHRDREVPNPFVISQSILQVEILVRKSLTRPYNTQLSSTLLSQATTTTPPSPQPTNKTRLNRKLDTHEFIMWSGTRLYCNIHEQGRKVWVIYTTHKQAKTKCVANLNNGYETWKTNTPLRGPSLDYIVLRRTGAGTTENSAEVLWANCCKQSEGNNQDMSAGLFLKKHFPTAERRMAKELRLSNTVTLSRRALKTLRCADKVNCNTIHETDLT